MPNGTPEIRIYRPLLERAFAIRRLKYSSLFLLLDFFFLQCREEGRERERREIKKKRIALELLTRHRCRDLSVALACGVIYSERKGLNAHSGKGLSFFVVDFGKKVEFCRGGKRREDFVIW